jgi:hypothetical protein
LRFIVAADITLPHKALLCNTQYFYTVYSDSQLKTKNEINKTDNKYIVVSSNSALVSATEFYFACIVCLVLRPLPSLDAADQRW